LLIYDREGSNRKSDFYLFIFFSPRTKASFLWQRNRLAMVRSQFYIFIEAEIQQYFAKKKKAHLKTKREKEKKNIELQVALCLLCKCMTWTFSQGNSSYFLSTHPHSLRMHLISSCTHVAINGLILFFF